MLDAIRSSEAVIYSIGSLYTSIIPSLILRGVGEAITGNGGLKYRILILNSKLDRETGNMTGRDFVEAIARAAGTHCGGGEVRRYVSHLVYLEGEGTPVVDVEELRGLGIVCVRAGGRVVGEGRGRMVRYDEEGLGRALEGVLEGRW